MTRIRCLYLDCVYLDDEYCTNSFVIFDPDTGCETYTSSSEPIVDEDWEEDEEEIDVWDSFAPEEDDSDELWFDEEEDEEDEDY